MKQNRQAIGEKVINLINSILNPYSTIVTLIIGAIITLLATGDPPTYIKWCIDNKIILTIILSSWGIIVCLYPIVQYKEKQIILLKDKLQEKNRQLEQNSGVIFNKYGELAKFNKKNRFYEALKLFVDNNISVDSAQLYYYSSKIDKKKLIIKLHNEEGYACEGIDINNILQSYYTMDEKTYKTLKEILSIRRRYTDLKGKFEYSQNEVEMLYNSYMRKTMMLAKLLIKDLDNIKNVNDITEENFSQYRLVSILASFIFDKQEGNLLAELNILKNSSIEDYLKEAKRTGILGAVLIEDTFIFKHVRNNSKDGRMYVCSYIEINNQKYILLFTVKSPDLNNEMRWNLEMEYLISDFIERLTFQQ